MFSFYDHPARVICIVVKKEDEIPDQEQGGQDKPQSRKYRRTDHPDHQDQQEQHETLFCFVKVIRIDGMHPGYQGKIDEHNDREEEAQEVDSPEG